MSHKYLLLDLLKIDNKYILFYIQVMNAERPHQILSGTEEVYTPVRDRSVDLGSAHLGGIRKVNIFLRLKLPHLMFICSVVIYDK